MSNKVMACIDLKDKSVSAFKEIFKSTDWSDVDELHIVSGFPLQTDTDGFYILSYPLDELQDEVKKSVLAALSDVESVINKDLGPKKIIKECIISSSPKATLTDYAKDNDINKMMITTRGKHGIEGFFSSSFAEYMVRHSKCELQILRE
jgi:nucleotide-binding universal stress UspA family protein